MQILPDPRPQSLPRAGVISQPSSLFRSCVCICLSSRLLHSTLYSPLGHNIISVALSPLVSVTAVTSPVWCLSTAYPPLHSSMTPISPSPTPSDVLWWGGVSLFRRVIFAFQMKWTGWGQNRQPALHRWSKSAWHSGWFLSLPAANTWKQCHSRGVFWWVTVIGKCLVECWVGISLTQAWKDTVPLSGWWSLTVVQHQELKGLAWTHGEGLASYVQSLVFISQHLGITVIIISSRQTRPGSSSIFFEK